MSQAIQLHKERANSLENLMRSKLTKRIASILPKAIGTSPERFLATVFAQIQTTPALSECTPASLMTAVVRAAQAGIELDGVQGALVPFKEKGTPKATFVPMYHGIIKAMYRSGVVASVQVPRLVYKGDAFEYQYGTDEWIRHVPMLDASNRTDDNIMAGYCVITTMAGARVWEITPRRVFDARKARAKTKMVWTSDFAAMCMKTCVLITGKYVAQSSEQAELSRMIAREEKQDAGIHEPDLNFDDDPGQVHLDTLDDLIDGERTIDVEESHEQQEDLPEF